MNHYFNFTRLFEYISVALLFFSLFTSKAGIYIATSLLIIYGIYLCAQSETWRAFFNQHRVVKLSFTLYAIGLICSLTQGANAENLALFARKGSFLLVFPFTYFLLKQSSQLRKVAIGSLLLGAVTAFFHSGQKVIALEPNLLFNTRITSLWDIGRWGEVLTYLSVLLLPTIHYTKQNFLRFLLISLLVITLTFLLLSGSRGPLLATFITVFLFAALRNWKLLLITSCSIIIFSLLLFEINPDAINGIAQRISSMTNITSDFSNISRLVMWKEGIQFSLYNAEVAPLQFIFGSGVNNLSDTFILYLEQNGKLDNILLNTGNQFSFSDHHNAFIDNLNKMGAIYSIMYIVFITALIKSAWLQRKENPLSCDCTLALLSAFIIIGIFYSNALEFQTIVLFSLLALSFSLNNDEATNAS